MSEFTVRDSGRRAEYPTGAVRDTAEGKGRFDLISPYLLTALAKHLEKGAAKYGDNNWQKGLPKERCIDSALRHISQYNMGDKVEDHLSAAVFNLMVLIHYRDNNDPIA